MEPAKLFQGFVSSTSAEQTTATPGSTGVTAPSKDFMRSLLFRLHQQVPLLRTVILTVFLPVVLIYLVLAVQRLVPVSLLLRDANAEVHDPQGGVMFYRGALSNIGILLWWTSASVCAFAAFLFRFKQPSWSLSRVFLVYMAVFTGLLALDDLFMFHEEVLPVRLGISELALYAVYGVLAAGFVGFIELLLETDFLLLGLAFGFFAFSVLTDQGMLGSLFDIRGGAELVAEDLAKMLGIICWLIFSLRTAVQLLRSPETASEPFLQKDAGKTVVTKVRQPKTQRR